MPRKKTKGLETDCEAEQSSQRIREEALAYHEAGHAVAGATMRYPLCWFCKHIHARKLTCAAYPDGIPDKFSSGSQVHLNPEDGDNGIQFEVNNTAPEDSKLIALEIAGRHRAAMIRPGVTVETGPMNDEPPPGRISPADALEAVLSAESHEHLEAICEVLEELEDEPEDETDDEDTSPRDMAAVAAYQKARDKRTWAEIERRRAAKGKQPRQ